MRCLRTRSGSGGAKYYFWGFSIPETSASSAAFAITNASRSLQGAGTERLLKKTARISEIRMRQCGGRFGCLFL